MPMSNMLCDVVQSAAQVISRPFASFFEKTGSGMEPDLAECSSGDIIQDERTAKSHLFRLFVGWVPKLFTEQDLLPLFQKYGDVKDTIILKDKVSGQPRGCAFVSYATKEEADAAIHALDKGVHLPGALCPMEVRYARSHLYIQAGSGPQDNRQLFFARAPLLTTEDELKQLFSQFGGVESINLFRERRTHASKGCGFVTMSTREQAVAAMNALDEKQLLEGSVTQLAVKWADPELQIKKKRAVEDSNAENRMLFFAKVLRSANEDEVKQLFMQFGRVVEVNLFRAFQGAPTTKGCGLVTMGSNDEAAAAIEALDSRHTWEGLEAPMVVKWMDAALQKRRREEHLLAMRTGQSPVMSMSGSDIWSSGAFGRAGSSSAAAAAAGAGGASSSRAAGLSQSKLLDAAAGKASSTYKSESSFAQLATGATVSGTFAGTISEQPPVGCAPDAYKLFVGNIPKNYTEENLRPVFESIGPVVELVVVRDKFTHESKGSAFVWYRTRVDADQAVVQYNLCRILSDPSGEQTRPLVVRRANMRKPAAAVMAVSPNPGSHPSTLSSTTGLTGPGTGPVGLGVSAIGPGAMSSSGSIGGVMDLSGLGCAVPGGSLGTVPDMQMQLQQPMAAIQLQVQQQQAADQLHAAAQMGLYAPVYPAAAAEGSGGAHLLGQYPQATMQAAFGAAAAPAHLLQQMQVQQQHMQQQQQIQQQQFQQQQIQQQQVHQQPYFLTTHGTRVLPAQAVPGAADPGFGGASFGGAPTAAAVLGPPTGGIQQVVPVVQAGLPGQGLPTPELAGGAAGPIVQMSMQLSTAQMMALSQHLYAVSAMSGADVTTMPVAGGVYYVNLTGARNQVENARQVLSGLINQLQQSGVV